MEWNGCEIYDIQVAIPIQISNDILKQDAFFISGFYVQPIIKMIKGTRTVKL